MPMKHYGIYLAYPPMTDLKKEGLGRYLAMFLKGAENLGDVRFTIVCPSWSKESLADLFASERVSGHLFSIQTPLGEPYALKFFERINNRKKAKRRKWMAGITRRIRILASNFWHNMATEAVQVHSVSALLLFIFSSSAKLLLGTALAFLALPIFAIAFIAISIFNRVRKTRLFDRLVSIFAPNANNGLAMHLFDEMHRTELSRNLLFPHLMRCKPGTVRLRFGHHFMILINQD